MDLPLGLNRSQRTNLPNRPFRAGSSYGFQLKLDVESRRLEFGGMMRVNRIYTRSCEDMRELDGDSVALTVTSPPYWNAIDYDIHALNKEQHYRTRKYALGYADYEEYLDWLGHIFGEVLRVTK